MKNSKIVLVKWKQRGALIRKGEAWIRFPGDEDRVKFGDIRGLVASGKVQIVKKDIPEIKG